VTSATYVLIHGAGDSGWYWHLVVYKQEEQQGFVEKSGNGGTFTVDAKAASGVAVTGTIKCDSFAPHVAEGGL
jgi:hypothetical protein